MKQTLALVLLVFGIVGCSKEIPSDQLVERQGIYYEVNSQTPFTGRVVSYHENGQLEAKGNFKDGELHGLMESYHENGQLWIKRNYKDGELHGLMESYHENGQLLKRANYKDGEIDGLLEVFDKEGNPTKIEVWKDGVRNK